MKRGQNEDALREARRVAKLDEFPRLKARALFVMARASEMSGREDAARSLYREIVQNYPFESRLIRASGHRLNRSLSRR
jgi:hypothetical protein